MATRYQFGTRTRCYLNLLRWRRTARSEGIVKLQTPFKYNMNIIVAAANKALVAGFLVQAGRMVLSHLSWRRSVKDACIADLEALNSPDIFRTPLDTKPNISSIEERRGNAPPARLNEMQLFKRRTHSRFCAKWARAVKGRFLFANQCDDSPINRAAVHRWLLSEWKQLGIPYHHIDLFMADTLELCFEPTNEYWSVMSKRKQRKFARMEYYNEKKALSVMR